jgi:hypothetical protein
MLLWNAVSEAVLRGACVAEIPRTDEEIGKALQLFLFPASKFIHPIEMNSAICVQASRDRKRRLQHFES